MTVRTGERGLHKHGNQSVIHWHVAVTVTSWGMTSDKVIGGERETWIVQWIMVSSLYIQDSDWQIAAQRTGMCSSCSAYAVCKLWHEAHAKEHSDLNWLQSLLHPGRCTSGLAEKHRIVSDFRLPWMKSLVGAGPGISKCWVCPRSSLHHAMTDYSKPIWYSMTLIHSFILTTPQAEGHFIQKSILEKIALSHSRGYHAGVGICIPCVSCPKLLQIQRYVKCHVTDAAPRQR